MLVYKMSLLRVSCLMLEINSLSVCAVRTLLGVDQKILSIRKKTMLSGFSHSKCSEVTGLTVATHINN